jgi:hypothetical protein
MLGMSAKKLSWRKKFESTLGPWCRIGLSHAKFVVPVDDPATAARAGGELRRPTMVCAI